MPVAYPTLYNSYRLGIARPSLTPAWPTHRPCWPPYNGTGDDAQQYGRELIGLSNVLENHNQLSCDR
ncbi:hypothetical protein ACWCP8_06835 [Streptomyces sp. NPDC002206]